MENNEIQTSEKPETSTNLSEEIKDFYKGSFKQILSTFFNNPIEGIHSLIKNASANSYNNSLILIGSIFVFYTLGLYFMAGSLREYTDFSVYVKSGLIPVLFILIVTTLIFSIKSFSGNPNFKAELFTGSLCTIPLSLLLVSAFLLKIFLNLDNVLSIIDNPKSAGMVAILIPVYLTLMIINIFQQSLKASGSQDYLAWYLSPIATFFALYITFTLSSELFF